MILCYDGVALKVKSIDRDMHCFNYLNIYQQYFFNKKDIFNLTLGNLFNISTDI
jgi:hypothetical protein